MKTLSLLLLLSLFPVYLSSPPKGISGAGKAVDEVYLLQAAGPCLKLLPRLDEKKRRLFLFNFGPLSRIAGKFFLEECHCLPGCGNYPPNLDLQALREAMKEDRTGELRIGVNSPLTVVVQGEEGFRVVPYHQFYGDKLKELSEQLSKIETSDPSLKSYLDLRAREVLTDRFEEGDKLWLEINGELKIYFGPAEVEDPYLGVKMAYGGVVFEVLPWEFADSLSPLLPRLQRELPLPWKNLSPLPYPGIRLARLLQAYGKFRAPPATSFAVLPPFLPTRARKYLFLNVMEARFENALAKAGEMIRGWKGSLRAYLRYLALHDLSHFLNITMKEGSGFVKEIFADAGAVRAVEILKKGGTWNGDLSEAVLHSYLASLLYYSARGKKPALVQLNYLLSRGGIKIGRDGKIEKMDSFDRVMSSMWRVSTVAMQGKGHFPASMVLPRELASPLKPLSGLDFYLEFNKIKEISTGGGR